MGRKRVSEPHYSRSGAGRSAGAGESVQISEGETPGRCGNCCSEGGRYFGKRYVPLSIPARESGYSEQSHPRIDRKSTRLNSSHVAISYAVLCLKKNTHNVTNQVYDHIIHNYLHE